MVHAVVDDGAKSVVDATELVITLTDGKELRILLRKSGAQSDLTLVSDDASITLKPGACNLLRISLEDYDKSCESKRVDDA